MPTSSAVPSSPAAAGSPAAEGSPGPSASAGPIPSALPTLPIEPGASFDSDSYVPRQPPRNWVDDPGRPLVVDPRAPVRTATTKRTNIVVLMVDDLAEMDLRVWERLPHIKQWFLDKGLRLTNYYGNDPLCCPGRANFLTGLYTDHHGVYTNDSSLLDPSETLATELHAVGYTTIISGKYLNFTGRLADLTPPGWSRSSIFGGGYYDYQLVRDGVGEFHDNDANDYSTDVFANDAVTFLRQAPASKPIFAFLTPYGVHAGADEHRRLIAHLPAPAPRDRGDSRCAGLAPWHPANFDEADVSDKPSYIGALQRHTGTIYQDGWPTQPLCETLLSVDDEFGRVVDELRREGRLGRTLFMLTADNGMGFGAHRWPGKYAPYTTQLPLFVSWADGRGTDPASNDSYLSNVDLASTLCAVGGCVMGPYASGRSGPDGLSFLDLITQGAHGPVREALYEEHREPFGTGTRVPPWRAIRTTPASPLGLWHYIEYRDGAGELYDASGGPCRDWQVGDSGDPCELDNLVADPTKAALVKQLKTLLHSLVVDPLPGLP